MKRFPALFFSLLPLLPLASLPAQVPAPFGEANPPSAQAPPTRASASEDLRRYLIGTKWSWKWGDRDQRLAFLADGTVKQDYFVAQFVVKGPVEVELQLEKYTARLIFDASRTRYEGTDFDGKRPIHGERVDVTTTAAIAAPAPVPIPAIPPTNAVVAQAAATPSVSQPASGPRGKAAPATSQENMKKTLELLKLAQAKLQSPGASTTPKAEPLLLVESAMDTLKQTNGDGRYSGHRAKAIKAIANAHTELKAGDRQNKAIGFVTEGTSEVYTCVGISR